MKTILLSITMMSFLASAQIGYTVTVTKLMATADDCDGGGFCLLAPQDPVFNVWVTDAQANENTNCWAFNGAAYMLRNVAFGEVGANQLWCSHQLLQEPLLRHVEIVWQEREVVPTATAITIIIPKHP